jgi:hypothetical protein
MHRNYIKSCKQITSLPALLLFHSLWSVATAQPLTFLSPAAEISFANLILSASCIDFSPSFTENPAALNKSSWPFNTSSQLRSFSTNEIPSIHTFILSYLRGPRLSSRPAWRGSPAPACSWARPLGSSGALDAPYLSRPSKLSRKAFRVTGQPSKMEKKYDYILLHINNWPSDPDFLNKIFQKILSVFSMDM